MPSKLTESRLYKIWADMKQRCNNKNHKKYHLYGGKGVKVCPEWTGSFHTFEDWAYSHGYRELLTLDRINSNSDYKPDNCRWATYEEQGNNISTNHRFTYDGQTHTIAEWSRIWGVAYSTARGRVCRMERKTVSMF